MDPALKAALGQPDFDDVFLAAVDHADTRIRKFIWRGHRPNTSKATSELLAGDMGAGDFVMEALRRLCDGTRKYNQSRSLLENLNSITDSLIWSEKKSSDRTGLTDFAQRPGEPEELVNPIVAAPCPKDSPDGAMVGEEIIEAQRKCFKMIRASFDGDRETQEYLDALEQGYRDIEEISQLTGIHKDRIYEIRRKLKDHAPNLFGVQNYKEFNRKISGGY
jgi:hypothetical protein